MEPTKYWQNKYCQKCKRDCQRTNLELFNCVVRKLGELNKEIRVKSIENETIKPLRKSKKSTQHKLVFLENIE